MKDKYNEEIINEEDINEDEYTNFNEEDLEIVNRTGANTIIDISRNYSDTQIKMMEMKGHYLHKIRILKEELRLWRLGWATSWFYITVGCFFLCFWGYEFSEIIQRFFLGFLSERSCFALIGCSWFLAGLNLLELGAKSSWFLGLSVWQKLFKKKGQERQEEKNWGQEENWQPNELKKIILSVFTKPTKTTPNDKIQRLSSRKIKEIIESAGVFGYSIQKIGKQMSKLDFLKIKTMGNILWIVKTKREGRKEGTRNG